jgi:midasin (ATPase involved in ribosome maturation)
MCVSLLICSVSGSETCSNDSDCFVQLTRDLQSSLKIALNLILERQGHSIPEMKVSSLERAEDRWGVYPFFIQSTGRLQSGSYNFDTETARRNLYIVLRAMQLNRPILLEGSPGVGKTTLVEAMCQSVGQRFVRINLSDQTDMMDLLGANLPSPDGSMGEFVWYGTFLEI